MRYILLLLFSTLSLYSLELRVSSGSEGSGEYSILYIDHKDRFSCKELKDTYDKTIEVLCVIKNGGKITFSKSETKFFKIYGEMKGEDILIHIFPKTKVLLKPIIHDFKYGNEVIKEDSRLSKIWEIVGYERDFPLLKKTEKRGINFPISIDTEKLPYISALDSLKNPLVYEEGKDVPLYLRAKQLYETKEYSQAIYTIDDIMTEFPDTIFKKELLLYRIRAMDKTVEKDDMDDLVELAKSWIKTYSADEGVSEVLLILANAYSEMGFFNEARYYFDRLFFEHKGDKYEKLAKIYLGDQFYIRGDINKAIGLYNEALLETKDIDVASLAAAKIGERSLDNGKTKDGGEYYLKILNANPDFYKSDIKGTKEICEKLADKKEYIAAAKICSILSGVLDPKELEYDKNLKAVAIWFDTGGDKEMAFILYNKYLDELENGISRGEVKERLDSLAISLDEQNQTKRLEKLQEVITKYPESEAYKGAIIAKAEILYKEQRYEEVLLMEDELKVVDENGSTAQEIIDICAKALVEDSLSKGSCDKALNLLKEHNITVEGRFDNDLYWCYFEASYFQQCFNIGEKNIRSGDLANRVGWMYKTAKCAKEIGKPVIVDDLSKDILDISKTLKIDKYDDILYDRFYTLMQRGKVEDGLLSAIEIEARFAKNKENFGVYRAVVNYANEIKNDTLLIQYTNKIFDLQKALGVKDESPYVDFLFVQSSIKNNQNKEALKRLDQILDFGIKDEERARAHYMKGNILQLEKNTLEAKMSYEACSKIDINSPWVNLCKDALKLLE